ncbi:hypothetical protein MSG28_003965 [Choristoneura fumiferana]|uniref:Uncharacterized protein n=1 Tax=Choristoneura fumiferana TaxID=7141 RepID=A0ACC0KI30_CHOFU|nr:hypothetical protein MSG28_003965 [Choristoneura fumiferana]
MEHLAVSETRSRSRSKTPFLRSSCDHENCTEGEEHTHPKSGRKTPIKRSTPIKQLQQTTSRTSAETISEEVEEISQPVVRTRQSARQATENLVKTSDYSSEESLDRLKGHRKEIFQNEVNSQYERVSTTSRYGTLADLTLSPINASHVTTDRTTRFGSPAYSACSTDSSFAEQTLADANTLLDRDPGTEHLPYRLYKLAGEYWNKYPKTDYTYSPLSKDRVELAPGQIAVPNMSRRSLSQFRVQGPNTSVDEVDRLAATTAWTAHTLRKRYTAIDSSDDEAYVRGNGYPPVEQRWWLTRLLITIITSITTTVSSAYRSVVGPAHRYPYTERRPAQAGILSRSASVAAAPFYWIYTIIKTVVTTTVTTVTETFSPSEASVSSKHAARSYQEKATKRRWWPWLLLLLPLLGYGSYYTYENLDSFAMPNFTDFNIDLSEFSALTVPKISLPNITLPTFNLSLPDINITLPDIRENLPEVSKTYVEYRDIVQNRMTDASEYVKVVAESCFEELRRFWRGVLG